MARRDATNLTKVLTAVEQNGLLLQADSKLPSVVTLLVGEPVRGSWWGHPMGDAIHIVNIELKEHPDVIATHLVSGKVTYVHRCAWPALFGVALSGEPWQSHNLEPLARRILGHVTKKQSVRADDESVEALDVAPGKDLVVQLRRAVDALEEKTKGVIPTPEVRP